MELKISDAEWEVMEIIWQRKEATAAEVIAELAEMNRWNHRTVRTMLARLVEKGALAAQSDGNRYLYRAKISRTQCVRNVSRSFLEKVFGGDVGSLLAHFVDDPRVTADDLAELRKLLDTQRGKQ